MEVNGKMKSHFVRLVCCSTVLSSAGAHQINRLYVEPFATRPGMEEKLRAKVLSELHKLRTISIASDPASADAVLGGGGEVWIKSYQSLNPRSGRMPSNGTPIYGGYLSVELRNPRGETLWSYIATPESASSDISGELAKRIVKHLVPVLEKGAEEPARTATASAATVLHGAGATFPYPVYSKWITNYRRENPGTEITYDAVGSEAGMRRLLAGDADFGATDDPEAIRQIAPREEWKYLLLPSVIGAVVPIVNLPGIAADLRFTPEILSAIYLGRIRKWNDPALKEANRGISLPDLDIVVVHRAEGSGTSYAFTDFLSETVPEWKARVGPALAPAWPIGRAATGNEGVAGMVKEFGGSIGYVEFIYALQHHLAFGRVRTRGGEFVSASLESIAAAASHAVPGDDFKISIVNSPGAGAYPIASFTWLVVPLEIADAGKREALSGFLKWILGPGQNQAAALGYLALPKELVGREVAALATIRR